MAVFPLEIVSAAAKQDWDRTLAPRNTLSPLVAKWSYANLTLMGKGAMTHKWDNFHKESSSPATSIERCVDFLACKRYTLFFLFFPNTTNLKISHRPYKSFIYFFFLPNEYVVSQSRQITANQASFEKECPTLPKPSLCCLSSQAS